MLAAPDHCASTLRPSSRRTRPTLPPVRLPALRLRSCRLMNASGLALPLA
jgi:hypothetical protein